MKKILILFAFLFPAISFSQTFCPDSLAIYGTFSSYSVDSFSLKTSVEIHLSNITAGTKEIKLDFTYKSEIEFETPIIPLSDSLATKLLIAPYQRYGKKFYLYTLLFYRKENYRGADECWIESGSSDYMSIVISQTFKTNGTALGNPASPYYFRVNDGWIKLN
jgi:hypothetical protein